MNPNDEAVQALVQQHWLVMARNGTHVIAGCNCGFPADWDSDAGYGDSVVRHLFEVAAAAVRAEAVADEQRRIESDQSVALVRDLIHDAHMSPRQIPSDALARQITEALAAGSVPVATPETTCSARGCRELVCCLDPVSTPPAEPAQEVHDSNCEQQVCASRCHCQKRADVAFSHAEPAQPVEPNRSSE